MEYNPTRTPRLRQATTVHKIIVLITTGEEGQTEIRRQESVKQGDMGAKVVKGEGLMTPVELVIRKHPDNVKQIRECVNKWHKRTSGALPWPEKGTFDAACCKEIETSIKHYKSKNLTNSREGR